MDDFTLAPEPLAPQFDFTNAQTPPFVQAPNQAKTPQGGMDKKQAMKLAIMLPLALKAGPGAVQGLLQGFNQHAETQYTRGRQQAADTRTQEQRDWQRNYQQGQLDNQRQTQQRQFLNDFATRVGSLDDPAAIDALTRLYAAQAGAMGIDASALQTYAQQYGNPTKLQQRAAEKAIAKLKSQYGEKWMEMGAQFTHRIGGSDQPVPFEQLLSMAGLQRDPNAPAIQPKQDVPNTPEEQYYATYAQERGTTWEKLPAKDKQAARKAWMQADDRPQPQATVLIQTVDQNGNPIQQFVQKTPGQQFAVAPTAGQQTAMAEQETGIALIGDIDRLYQPQYVGPAVARLTRAQMAIPGAPDVKPEVAQFYASVAGLRNEIIRLMSGAAVSGAEETRMRSQIPDVTDKPSTFQAKLNQTRRNRETLLQRTQTRSGQKVTPMSSHTAGGTATPPQRVGRFEVTVED
jgi:hypothetical protein